MNETTDHIKLFVDDVTYLATKKSYNTAIIGVIPIDGPYTYGDLVEFDSSRNIVKVIISNYRKAIIRYPVKPTLEIKNEHYKIYAKYFAVNQSSLEKNGWLGKGYVSEIIYVAIPKNITNEQAEKIVTECGATIQFE